MDVALAVGLQLAPPERLRFFVASDSPTAIAEFTAGVAATLERDFPKLQRSKAGSGNVVFHAGVNQSTHGAAVDMQLLGMANETGESSCKGCIRRTDSTMRRVRVAHPVRGWGSFPIQA